MIDGGFPIPASFAERMRGVYGVAAADDWLARLPGIVEQVAEEWGLVVGPPVANLSFTWVAPAERRDGARAMLKVGYPDAETWPGVEMLRLCDGRGMVRLLEADREFGATLLERLEPGTMLRAVEGDDEAMAIAADVMAEMWQPEPAAHGFPHVADWARGLARLRERFDGGTGPLPRWLVEQAEALFAELLPSMSALVVLHGDLHHENILAASRAPWLAIDPKGIVGEPAYEPGALLRNPIPEIATMPQLPRLLSRRIDLLSERLDLDRQRVRGWGIAQAVLSAWWDIDDETGGWEIPIACAEALVAV
ncbi:MAG TPA: aminoglycoside phosphotransferase family protein [Thermomicrobiales bacterium]|nr:aminoglycoside phosphotransferase family protein [Thermomicrobiales bacterium]